MRPCNSNYDRNIAAAVMVAMEFMDPDKAEVGDSIDYDEVEEIGEVGMAFLREELERQGLAFEDDGSGLVVRDISR